MRVFRWVLLLLISASVFSAAHSGHGSSTNVRVFQDEMRLVIRTSIPMAWARLGPEAPMIADDAGKALALPVLIASAPSMVRVTAGGEPLLPVKTNCMFEVGDHVAFMLNFPRPVAWPVEIDSAYLKTAGQMDAATIEIFDLTASRFGGDLMPLMVKRVSAGDPVVSFTLDRPGTAVAEEAAGTQAATPVSTTGGQAGGGSKWKWRILLIAAAITACLCLFESRRRAKTD